MSKQKALLLFGGGLDAAAMVELYQEAYDMHFLYVDYGAKAKPGEVHAMEYWGKKYGFSYTVLPIPPETFPSNPITNSAMTADHKDDYLPGRNLLLASLGFAFAHRVKAQEIWLGAAPTDDPYMLQWARDMQQPFVDGFNIVTAFSYGIDTPRFRAPLLSFHNKLIYVSLAKKREPQLFNIAFSCYQSNTLTPCGECAHCVFRKQFEKEVDERLAEEAKGEWGAPQQPWAPLSLYR